MKLDLSEFEWKALKEFIGNASQVHFPWSVAVYNRLKAKTVILNEIEELETKLDKLKSQL